MSAGAAALALAALGLPSAASAQLGPQRQLEADLQDQIRDAELRDGPNSADVIDPLTDLGQLYRDSGEPFLASALFRRAVEVARFNYGLHSLEQAPLIRELIATAESVGDRRSAWDLDQALLALARRHPDDLRSAEILREMAERRMDVLARYDAGESPPEVVLGCYYEPRVERGADGFGREGNCTAGSAHNVRQALVAEAQAYRVRAVNIILNQRYASDALPSLLTELVDSSYRYGNPRLGRRSLTYLLAYEASRSGDSLASFETLVQIADWDLLHAVGRDEEQSALAEYAEAYRVLARQQTARELVDRLFAPEVPVVLPAFLPNPLARDDARATTSHIDVAFEVNRYGRTRHVRVLDASHVVDPAGGDERLVEKRLVQLISRARFRPRFADGHVADAAPVVVRYEFNPSDGSESRWPLYWEPAELLR